MKKRLKRRRSSSSSRRLPLPPGEHGGHQPCPAADAVAGKKEYPFTDVERIGNVAVLEALAKSTKSGKRERVRN